MTVAERIITIMNQRNLTAYKVETNCELPNGTIHNLKAKKYIPSTSVIIKIAPYLNVSADYLLGLVSKPLPLATLRQLQDLVVVFNQLDTTTQKELLQITTNNKRT